MRDLSALPKAELHLHLEGAMRVDTVRDLADRQGLPIPSGLTDAGWRFDDSLDFIDQYVALCSLLNDLDDFRRLAREVCEDLAANGVRYAEAVFSPSNHADRLGGDWFGPIEAILDGLAAGERDTGVVVRLDPDIVRDLGEEHADRVLEVALKYAGRGVVALNCAGSERTDIGPFARHFRAAKEAGLKSVPHAGEWAGPENVWATLEAYGPDRIGHGVAAARDPELIERLRRPGDPSRGVAGVERRDGRLRLAQGAPLRAAPRRGRRRHAELRRPTDVRRVARRRLRGGAGYLGLHGRAAR